MRTIVTILLMMFLAQTTKAQEFIFETTAGEIVTKSKFIDQFQNDVYTNITPYILKQTTNESLQNGDSYTINCLKYRNWGNDPGDIHVIQVLHQGKEVFKLNNDEGWKYINEEPDGGITKTKFYYSIDLDKNTKVLIFVGIYIQSLPPYISMIVLKSVLFILSSSSSHGTSILSKSMPCSFMKLQRAIIFSRDVVTLKARVRSSGCAGTGCSLG